MTAKHTPGPWLMRQGDEWTRDIVTDHGELEDGSRNYWNVASVNIRRDERDANLRLIAAAPDLLDALIRLVGTGLHHQTHDEIMSYPSHYVNVAIAKATGKAPWTK